MQIAQALYEGVDLKRDGGPVGLITYMRTDSTRVSADAIAEVRDLIVKQYGKAFAARRAERLQLEEERAGRPRSHPADERRHPPRLDPEAPQGRAVQALQAHLEPLRRVADDARGLRSDVGRHRRRPAARRTRRTRSTPSARRGASSSSPGWLQVTEGQREFAGEDEGDGSAGGRRSGARHRRRAAAKAPSVRPRPLEEDDDSGLLPELDEGDALELVDAARRARPSRSSRSRRRATTKARSCVSSRSAASAGRPRTPRSSARCSSAPTSRSSRAAGSSPRCSASSWSTASCDRTSTSWTRASPRRWRRSSTRSAPAA